MKDAGAIKSAANPGFAVSRSGVLANGYPLEDLNTIRISCSSHDRSVGLMPVELPQTGTFVE